jgi:aminoglycoside 2'-N-acetyltransferase I
MEIISTPQADVPPELRQQIRRLQLQTWPSYQPDVVGPTHDPALHPVSMLLVSDGRVIAALDILSKEILHGGHRYAARGLSTVVTDAELRGRGFGRQLVEAAYAAIEKSGVDLGIFTCDTPLRSFYERAGWQVLPGTVLVGGTPEAPFPSDQTSFDKVTIARFFSQQAQLEQDTFVGSRIALYPGEIDKLW